MVGWSSMQKAKGVYHPKVFENLWYPKRKLRKRHFSPKVFRGVNSAHESNRSRSRSDREQRKAHTTDGSRCLQLEFASQVVNVRLQGT